MIVRMIRQVYKILTTSERCPQRLALSCCIGVYIAFSPFVGLHTAMVFLFAWLFALNSAVMLTVSIFINNPWTMMPIYAIDYMVGNWLFHLFDLDGQHLNPQWVESMNTFIATHTGLQGLSLWAFLLGGNLLGLVAGGILYPILKRVLVRRFHTKMRA